MQPLRNLVVDNIYKKNNKKKRGFDGKSLTERKKEQNVQVRIIMCKWGDSKCETES